jgi:hypothetical protein
MRCFFFLFYSFHSVGVSDFLSYDSHYLLFDMDSRVASDRSRSTWPLLCQFIYNESAAQTLAFGVILAGNRTHFLIVIISATTKEPSHVVWQPDVDKGCTSVVSQSSRLFTSFHLLPPQGKPRDSLTQLAVLMLTHIPSGQDFPQQ